MVDPIGRLALYVESLPINKAELARKTHMSRSMICKMLKGERRVSIDTFCRLCEALDVDPRNFFTPEVCDSHT